MMNKIEIAGKEYGVIISPNAYENYLRASDKANNIKDETKKQLQEININIELLYDGMKSAVIREAVLSGSWFKRVFWMFYIPRLKTVKLVLDVKEMQSKFSGLMDTGTSVAKEKKK